MQVKIPQVGRPEEGGRVGAGQDPSGREAGGGREGGRG